MSRHQSKQQIIARADIVAPPVQRACDDQRFEIPAGIYAAMGAMFAGFVAVLALAFHGGHLMVAYGVIGFFIAAFFAVPALFPAMAPGESRNKSMTWFEFSHRGIMTATGRSSSREATTLILLLPFLILCFGIAVATIAALA